MFDFSKVDKKIKANPLEYHKEKIKKENINFETQALKIDSKRASKIAFDTASKLLKIEEELNNIFVERDNEIRMLTLAFASGANAFLHGPAGTGKSVMVEEYRKRIKDSNYFRILMGKTTEPGEIFGPVSINAMKNDIYKVNTKNKLPEANISFVDEIFKANSAVLNNLLTIMNEKLFFNEQIQKVPLISLIGASNEYYEDDSLVALYDRFLLRWHVDYIKEPANRLTLFKNYLGERKTSSKLNNSDKIEEPTYTINIRDLMIVNEKTKDVTIGLKVLSTYNKLIVTLLKKNIIISDRRKNESLKVVQASSLLDGRDTAEIEDLEVLKYTLWTNEDEIPILMEEINKLANPNKNKLNNLRKTFEEYKKQMLDIEKNKDSYQYAFTKTMAVTEIIKNINYAVNTISGVLAAMENDDKTETKDYNSFKVLLKELQDYAETIKKEIIL